jgi:hypothetical protein
VSRLAQDSQDVTDQLVDLDVRIRQAEASVERVELLLAEATELGEVFAIEKELTTRQITLEQLLATQRNTQDLVDLATLTVQVEYRTPDELEAIEQGDGIGDGFSSGWDAFVASVFAIAYVLAIGAPFLLTATAIGGVAWALSRRRAHQRAELREQRRLDADRLGPVIGAGAGQYPSPGPTSPPPPNASERSADAPSQSSASDSVATTAVAAPVEGVVATDEGG